MHEKIDTEKAIELYEKLLNWNEVARQMARRTGAPFQPGSISRAVRNQDRAA